jgi:branched-chain amino acid transport system substrate-binding protein
MRTVRWIIVLGLALMASALARADLVIAQISPFSGPLKSGGEAYYLGAKAYVDRVNAEGGIAGKSVRLVKEDDAYKPEETVSQYKTVAARDNPLAFINLIGSANATALLSQGVLAELRIPVVGMTPGAESSRNPGSPYLFHIQAGDRAQLETILAHLATIGVRRISVVYQDVPSGRDGLAFIEQAVGGKQMTVLQKVPVKVTAQDLVAEVAQLKKTPAQAYVMILASSGAGMLVSEARRQGDRTPIYALSYVTAQDLVTRAGAEAATGVALAQTSPNAAIANTPAIRDFQLTLHRYGPKDAELSSSTFFGYLAARTAVEAIRKAGPLPTPASVAAALRKLRLELGGYVVDFTKGNVGSKHVDIAVIDARGSLRY